MDLKLDYELFKSIYWFLGDAKFLELFNGVYSEFNLYSMSTDWINSKEYILKFKGTNGDIIVRWK